MGRNGESEIVMQIIRAGSPTLGSYFVVFVSDEDYPTIIQYKWGIVSKSRKPYAYTYIDGRRLVYMHRLIVLGTIIHHIDGNGLNNTRENLRAVSRYEHNKIHIWGRGK